MHIVTAQSKIAHIYNQVGKYKQRDTMQSVRRVAQYVLSLYIQIMTDGVVLPSIVQEYYLMKKLITRLGTILLNEVELGVVLEPSFTDVVLQMYRLSYDITTTVRRIVSILTLRVSCY